MKQSTWRPVRIAVGCLVVFALLLVGFIGPKKVVTAAYLYGRLFTELGRVAASGGPRPSGPATLAPAKAHKDSGLAGSSPFNGRRAYEELRRVVGFGPRPSGSSALAELRKHIEAELASAGLEVRRQEFDASTPIGPVRMVNITGVVQGTEPGIIILGNHYETKYLPQITFVGANDGGSTTAWMLEMARTLGPKRRGKSVWLCFFDGEESFAEWTASDSLYGSRHFVERLEAEGRLGEVAAMINVDMIGDCYLDIKKERDAPAWLTQIIWQKARDSGYGQFFLPFVQVVEDDHIPFRRAGIPAINIIDFSYGSSASEHLKNWHTANDTLDRVCGDSLQVVGDVIYHALPEIDAQTRRTGPASATLSRDKRP